MAIRVGSRIFAPRPFTTLLMLVLVYLLISLGRWQLHRAAEKRALYDAFDTGTDATRRIDAEAAPVPRYQHVQASGHYDGSRQILIDNMVGPDGRAGYYVITPFALAGGGWLLVNRGWVPVGASRAERPVIAVSAAPREVRGRADRLPRPGIHMGNPPALAPPYPVVASFPSLSELEDLLGEHHFTRASELVLLDAGEADGFVRRWTAPGFPPMRHVAYAVQWFGLAATLAVIYVVTNLRKSQSDRGS